MTMSEFLPEPGELLDRVRALPAAAPLLAAPRRPAGPVYLVGGAVRDLLLGGAPFDLDLGRRGRRGGVRGVAGRDAHGARPLRDLDRRAGRASPTTSRRARRETYAHPGALPDVEPAPLAEDLRRRDFTVNAIAIALGGGPPGRADAAPRALEDLDARRLRVLHDRSFIDDPTRLFRLARYAGRLGFEIEPHTRALADEAIDGRRARHGQRPARRRRAAGCSPASDDPVGALLALARARARPRRAPRLRARRRGARPAARSRCCRADGRPRPPRAGARGAGRPRGGAAGAARLAGVRGRGSRRDRRRRHARRELARRSGRPPRRRRRSPPRRAARRPSWSRWPGALGPERPAREWLERLRHVRLDDRRRDLLAAGVPEGPADRPRPARGAGREARRRASGPRAGAGRGAERRRGVRSSLAGMELRPARAFLRPGRASRRSTCRERARCSRPAAGGSPRGRTPA